MYGKKPYQHAPSHDAKNTPDDMSDLKQTWTRAHDLALIFIALAYGTDQELHEDELATITDVLQHWRENFPADEVQDVVMEAVAIFMGDNADLEVHRSMESLKKQLSLSSRQRALEDVVRIAEADGVLLSSELDLIYKLAEAWDIRSIGEQLLEKTTATVTHQPEWSLLHDIALLYIVLAHSSDNKITDVEINAMVERMSDWQPEQPEKDIRKVLRTALTFYSEGPDQEALQQSVQSVRDMMPVMHRLVLLDDLVYIAQADGAIKESERGIIDNLSQSWGVSIRVNGETTS